MTAARSDAPAPGLSALRPAGTGARLALGGPDQSAKMALRDAALAMDLALDDASIEKLLQYQAMILRWNRVYNLTALRTPAAVFVQHLLDSLSIVSPLHQRLGPTPGSVVDVGSGAGLPGIPLAILWPERQIHVVDPVGKKAAFLTQCRIDLALPNLQVHAQRVETLMPVDLQCPVALLICRAFTSLRGFVDATAHLATSPTLLAAMKAAQWQAECDAYEPIPPNDPAIDEVLALEVPGLEATRALILLRRTEKQ